MANRWLALLPHPLLANQLVLFTRKLWTILFLTLRWSGHLVFKFHVENLEMGIFGASLKTTYWLRTMEHFMLHMVLTFSLWIRYISFGVCAWVNGSLTFPSTFTPSLTCNEDIGNCFALLWWIFYLFEPIRQHLRCSLTHANTPALWGFIILVQPRKWGSFVLFSEMNRVIGYV